MTSIAVLMTCHNRKAKTLECLRHLYNQSEQNQEYYIDVYLVDDASTDGTGEAIRNAFPDVKIITGNGSLFWNRGMHSAWKAANDNYDYYLWLNDDTILNRDAVQTMLSAAHQTKLQAIVCGCTESTKRQGELTYGGGMQTGNKWKVNYPDGSLKECNIINGNCVLVPNYVYKIVGNLDWRFIHSIGDHDYSLRARKAGILSYTTGSFIGTCDRHGSLPKWCYAHVSLKERLKALYSPLGNPHPYYHFIYETRHLNIVTAVAHFTSVHVRALFPNFWNRLKGLQQAS